MGEERRCPYYYETKMFKRPPCNAKIIRKEPLLSHEGKVGQIVGPVDPAKGWIATDEKTMHMYIYECENGHVSVRRDGWADVKSVPPGTIKVKGFSGSNKIANTPPIWYQKLSEEEKARLLER